jgi:hypothetical protein
VKRRWRVMIVVSKSPQRVLRMATAEALGPPSWEIAMMGARLLRHGAEVRVVDQDAEHLGHRLVRRELRNWRPNLVLLHAGGSELANDPVPDARNLASLLTGWNWPAPVLACGPLAMRYGPELLEKLPNLTGLMLGSVGESMARGFDLDLPGVATLVNGKLSVAPTPEDAEEEDSDVLPAWQLFSLDAYAARTPGGVRTTFIGPLRDSAEATFLEVHHAVRRAGARALIFDDRDLGRDAELAEKVARGMFGAAPGVPWTCRVRADRVVPPFVLALAQGGCKELLVSSPTPPEMAALTPMDDPARPRLESAVEAVRVTGMSAVVLQLLGLRGQTRPMLSAWQRWFADRRIVVRPQVLLQHAGDRGKGKPTLDEARSRAGCWDNDLSVSDIERAVKMLGGGRTAPVGAP